MSGHSKWASIKHKKANVDAKRGKLFTKLIKELTVAARSGGANPEANPRLRLAVLRAKEANMPKDNIEKAIKKGTGELPGVIYEEVTYEGYGPIGVAILVEVLTDNKNRTASELRNIFSKKGGNMVGAGSVSWLFNMEGLIIIDKDKISEDKLMNLVLEKGAEDMVTQDKTYEIKTSVRDFENVKQAIETGNTEMISAELAKIPTTLVKVEDKNTAQMVLGLVNALEDHEDVQNVYANFDIPDQILNELGEES
ncbi:MAG: YebC/PmpR family DNA-binding transcriptional regulator [Candidatus Omnitrophica bacterium]|nr:YebC/PmpR family DNA-binding transcriptional regulator [Candidatus Omnitrophota bacterium]MBU1924447.1 YebC/PmpR family DNA-binding transcriptional regulator [Candidatus Omnitrophota bacterium]MBU2063597.1 YebC/PmpR family DNA-binding transcriptional regulator [Candidatus Omnitrophota bacterium]